MTIPAVGDLIRDVEVGNVAHGGHCVARHEGRVIFVRHALPGERVTVRLTDVSKPRFWLADAVEVIAPASERVAPRCPIAGPAGCGGCDLQHISPAGQREWKRAVVAEQLDRLAGYAWSGTVEPVAPQWGWRTRARFDVVDGEPGMKAHHSHRVLPLPAEGCVIAAGPRPDCRDAAPGESWLVVTAASGTHVLSGDDDLEVSERAAGRDYSVRAQGFWQVHPQAADTLIDAVLAGLAPQPGESAFDLYCGVGLFAGALVDRGVRVWGVEASRSAIALARRNVPQGRFDAAKVERALSRMPRRTDLIVLDPPRNGAGSQVMGAVLARQARAVAYVACDPAALARDLGTALAAGWQVASLRAFDLFPQTHHVECVAILTPSRPR